ncbi:hypothetical protein [Staphylococcus schweitzeri]|uniref:hypothetical protein n=1 Tax=Staphylococcus schweitzeri TaxID=1654388 RepID=UPI000502812E|nr:hypothetical protein [Staphylococcus schweitzeri]CDR62133.1 lipoprotein [Staphylococcus schweitzeri]
MRRLFSLLLASTLILVACGSDGNEKKEKKESKKSEVRKETKKNDDKPKNEKKNRDVNQSNTERVQNRNNNNNNNNNNNYSSSNYNNQQPNNSNNYKVIENGDTVTEIYNGQSHTTTNNPVRDDYVEGETDPIYKREYKHFYTPEEAKRAQENSDQALREMGLEPERYE